MDSVMDDNDSCRSKHLYDTRTHSVPGGSGDLRKVAIKRF
jgi:hypothetical protein